MNREKTAALAAEAEQRMMAAVKQRDADLKEVRSALRIGRDAIIKRGPMLASLPQPPEVEVKQLARLCRAQYALRLRDVRDQGRDMSGWRAEPEKPRREGSNADIIALANRVGAAFQSESETAVALSLLMNSCRKRYCCDRNLQKKRAARQSQSGGAG